MKKNSFLICAVLACLLDCGPGPRSVDQPVAQAVAIRSPEQVAYDQAILLALHSGRVHEAVKPVVVRAIVDLVGTSKKRPLSPQEKGRLVGLDALRRSADDWAKVHNTYLDILGAIEFFLEKPDRTSRDNARLAQLLLGLPKSNVKLEGAIESIERACRDLGLKVEI